MEGALSLGSRFLMGLEAAVLGVRDKPRHPGEPAPVLPNIPGLWEGPSAARWTFSAFLLFVLKFWFRSLGSSWSLT